MKKLRLPISTVAVTLSGIGTMFGNTVYCSYVSNFVFIYFPYINIFSTENLGCLAHSTATALSSYLLHLLHSSPFN